MENEKSASFGNLPGIFSSVSPPPNFDGSSSFSPPTTDMSSVQFVPRTVQGEIVIDNLPFSADLANKSSSGFASMASSIENEVMAIT